VLPELVHVDPATLVVSANVRADAGLDKQFVASVKDQGVLVPIVARRGEDGQLHVQLGQRRTLAAVEAGRPLVPVYVVDIPDDGKAGEVVRIVRQIIENDHRQGLRDADRVHAHQQLALLGLSAGQIARRTRAGVRRVKASLAVAGSELVAAAMDRFDLTLAQAEVLAEFDDDPEAVKALTVTARQDPDQFGHVAQRLRDDRAEAAARARAHRAAGHRRGPGHRPARLRRHADPAAAAPQGGPAPRRRRPRRHGLRRRGARRRAGR
jgi:ParB family chromosome partitioning protein